MDLEQELHPIKDDDFQSEDEHPNKTMLKRELRAIALKRLEDRIFLLPVRNTIFCPDMQKIYRQPLKNSPKKNLPL